MPKDKEDEKSVNPLTDDSPDLEEVAKEAADKISVKHGRDIQPSEATIADLATKEDSNEGGDKSQNKLDDQDQPISQFSTDLSKDPIKDEEGAEAEDGETKQQIQDDDREPPEIPKELRVNELVKPTKDTKKIKVVLISVVIGTTVGLGLLYLLRMAGTL